MPIYSHRAALCAVAAALFLPACGSKTDKPAGEAELVRAPVERGEIARIINAALGVLIPCPRYHRLSAAESH